MNTQHPIYQSEAKNLLFLFVYVAICTWLTHEALKRKKRTRHKRPEKVVLIFGRDSTGLNLVVVVAPPLCSLSARRPRRPTGMRKASEHARRQECRKRETREERKAKSIRPSKRSDRAS